MPEKLKYRYEVMFENMAQGVFFQNADGSLIDMNPAALNMFGLTRDQYLGRTSYDPAWQVLNEAGNPLPPDEHPSMVSLRTGKPVHNLVVGVYNYQRSCFVWMNVNAIPLFGQGSKPDQVFVTLDDITEKKRIEDIHSARNHLMMYEKNHSLEELLIETTNELERLTFSDIAFCCIYNEQRQKIELTAFSTHTLQELPKGKEAVKYYNLDKSKAWADCIRTKKPVILSVIDSNQTSLALFDRALVVPVMRQERIVAIVGVASKTHDYYQGDIETIKLLSDLSWDIAVHKRFEQQILNSQAQLRFLADQMPVLFAYCDQHCLYRFSNMPYAEFFGFHPAEIIGKHIRDVIGEDAYELKKHHIDKVLSGENSEAEFSLRSKSNKKQTFHVRFRPEKDDQGNVIGFIVAFMDISSRIQIETDLLINQYYLKKAQELGKIGTWELDLINNNLVWTEENCRIFGVPKGTPADYQLFLSRVHPEDRDYVNLQWQEAMHGKPYDIEHRLLIDGQVSWVREKADVTFSMNGDAISAIGFTQDITDKKLTEQRKDQLEADLLQARKFEALGTMAGGIAHNFNNDLAVILGSVELVKMKISGQTGVEKLLETALHAIFRSRDLVKQILLFNRQGINEIRSVKVHSFINEFSHFIKLTVPTSVNLTFHVPKQIETVLIQADEIRLQEALIHLCSNAVHAMNEKGNLHISFDVVSIEKEQMQKSYSCQPGLYLQMSIRDTGCGIPEDIIEKIFDPFFTTKEVGQGTGMGLSTVRGIMDVHHGFIRVDSKIDKGTTFSLYLPAQSEMAQQRDDDSNTLLRGARKILLVDDNESLTEVGESMLKEMGYQVTSTTDPLEALTRVKTDPDFFDLVITDQTMPNITGKELALQLKQIKPGLPVILCTGNLFPVTDENHEESGIDAFCLKPLSMTELRQAIGRFFSVHEK